MCWGWKLRGHLGGILAALLILVAWLAAVGPPDAKGERDAAQAAAGGAGLPGPSPVALREMIHSGDLAAVKAALGALPYDSPAAREHARSLFAIFQERHPKVIAFAEGWLLAEPTSPLAMTARGWSLHAEGWSMRGRGTARETRPDALELFTRLHNQGLSLMQAALAVNPALVPASDGLIAMASTTQRAELIGPEVARIMAILPSRKTLTLAAQGLAPNWGGSAEKMQALCQTYAPMVTDLPGYDAEVCMIDGTMQADYLQGAALDAMQERIRASDNPLIAEWNRSTAGLAAKSQTERLEYLDKVRQARAISYDEARVYDEDAEKVALLVGQERPKEFPAALARELARVRAETENNPGDWYGVERYMALVAEDHALNGTAIDGEDLWQRQLAALRMSLNEPKAWSAVGLQMLARSQPTDLADISLAEPYLINAVAHSNHNGAHLARLLQPKLDLLSQAKATDAPDWNDTLACPALRQARLLLAICNARKLDLVECSGLDRDTLSVRKLVAEWTAGERCPAEAQSSLKDLLYTPVQVEIAAN